MEKQPGPSSPQCSGVEGPSLADLQQKPAKIPTGLAHSAMLGRINTENRRASEALLQERKEDLRTLGHSLAALYDASTCHRKCWGTGHVLEALGGRIYNLACASYSLVSIGYYDESLNLVRSIGEIANLLSLSVCDKAKFEEWLKSTKTVRIREFSPAKVRALLSKSSGVLLMDEQWYSNLCAAYTHITPATKPNNFNSEHRNIVGGLIQAEGLDSALNQLTTLVSMVALFYCKYFELDDFFELIANRVQSENESGCSKDAS